MHVFMHGGHGHHGAQDQQNNQRGHLLEMIFGWKANPHAGPFHILSFVFIGGGFILISAAWKVLYDAQRARSLATSGPYSYVRRSMLASAWRSSASCSSGRRS